MANTSMIIDFLGTRGAFPLNLPETQQLGTETSCVAVTCGDDRLILDAGTGLNRIAPSYDRDFVILTHFHYDHILGLPYFLSRKCEGSVVLATSCAKDDACFKKKLTAIFGGTGFPVSLSEIFSPLQLMAWNTSDTAQLGPWEVTSIELNHPGTAFGYRVVHSNCSRVICYLMDHEPNPDYDNDALIAFSKAADLVIYDAAYSEDGDIPYEGFGHSTIEAGQRFRAESNCQKIAFMGHSLERLDSEIPHITSILDTEFELLAYDGLRITL